MAALYGLQWAGSKSGAVVIIHLDGSVGISHGGTEIGQGINGKVRQVAALTLGAPIENISVGPASTTRLSFNAPTGGSITSECCAEAVRRMHSARERIAPYQARIIWAELPAADDAGVNLLANGWLFSRSRQAPILMKWSITNCAQPAAARRNIRAQWPRIYAHAVLMCINARACVC